MEGDIVSPSVSVCIPVFNGEGSIGRTLESVMAQTLQDFDVHVVDNCSTDNTEAVVKSFGDERIHFKRNDTNIGAIRNFTRATESATAPFVKLLCADDELMPACLEKQATVLEERPDVVLVSSLRNVVDETGTVLFREWGLRGLEGEVPGLDVIAEMAKTGSNPLGEPSAAMFRASARAEAGEWSDQFPYATDVEMWARILEHGNLYALKETLCLFRVSPSSWSTNVAKQQGNQVADFVSELRRRYPERVSKLDEGRGRVLARARSVARRLTYRKLAWQRRRAEDR